MGLDVAGWKDVKLTGISVARQKERGTFVIEEFSNLLAEFYMASIRTTVDVSTSIRIIYAAVMSNLFQTCLTSLTE